MTPPLKYGYRTVKKPCDFEHRARKGRHCKTCGCQWEVHEQERKFKHWQSLGKCTNVFCMVGCQRYVECYHGPKHTHICARCHQEFVDNDVNAIEPKPGQWTKEKNEEPTKEEIRKNA